MNHIITLALKILPNLTYLQLYKRAEQKYTDYTAEKERLFQDLIATSSGKRCLQIGAREKKFAPHWTSCDLFDQSEIIDVHYDVMDLKFQDNEFDIVVCNAVLEHVPNPQKAISELFRVLKPGGKVWVEIPFNQPYHPSPSDFWRVSPEGVKIWMSDFQMIASGMYKIFKSTVYTAVFYFGSKKEG